MKAKIARKTRLIKQNFTLGLLVVLLVTLMAFSVTAIADTAGATGGTPSAAGLEINKTATYNESTNDYTITLEAYATGSKVTTTVNKDVPTDIVLVLDQSSSMSNDIGTVKFDEYKGSNRKNSNLYNNRHNGGDSNLWYKLADGSYVAVSVTKTTAWTQLSTSLKNYTTRGTALTSDCYYYYAENLYEKVGDEYKKVTVKREGEWYETKTYTYTFSDGTSVTSSGDDTKPDFKGRVLYTPADGNDTVYTYTYVDADGNVKNIGTSTGVNTDFTGATLYQRSVSSSGGGSRLVALKNAVKTFAENVNKKAKGVDGEYGTDDDVNHRIAVVGFATGDYTRNSADYPAYDNTELFIGSTQYNYNENASNYYASAFQDMSTEAGYKNVIASKDALEAAGATCVDLGLEMANGIFEANPVPANEKRNRVVIVFTDGEPSSWDSWSNTVADNAVDKSYKTKNTYGATVYTIGVFAGAKGEPVTSFDGVSNINKFLHLLSSNYNNAQSYTDSAKYGASTYPTKGSYYLTPTTADELNSIFQQIAGNISSDDVSTTLDSSAVITDIIAPQFQLPAGATAANITLETWACTGKNGDEYTWSKNDTAMGATATISGDQVDVTGFNFSENWVGTKTINDGTPTYRGHKLVIKFNEKAKDDFLGGNNVYTNTSAGVYENAEATNPVATFPKPQVNVPIKEVTVTAADKNVYLLGGLTADQIKEGVTANCENVALNLGADNYGLESWQNEYVNITVAYTDASGNTITDLSGLQDDTTYTVAVTVKPKEEARVTEGPANNTAGKTGSGEGKINVFKPELTFKDSEVYYGDNAPTDYVNKDGEATWKHGETASTDAGVTVIGEKPTLDLTYTPDSTKVVDGKVAVKSDIPVDVTVKIGTTDVTNKTTFQHTNCTGKTCNVPDGKEFLLHVKTCTLTITKEAAFGTSFDANESFIFNISKDGEFYTQVTISCDANGNIGQPVIISELPVGTYTVAEDTNWSWRYTASTPDAVTLSSTNHSGGVTVTNSLTTEQWLNGVSIIVKNVFGFTEVQ